MEVVRRLQVAAELVDKGDGERGPNAEAVTAQCREWGVTATLKPHQAEGIAWLIGRYLRGVNVILGDEMGLGKTLQSIALLAYLKTRKSCSGPFLVLCPLSVTEGWALELVRFAPNLKVLRYAGNKEERESLRKTICNHVNRQSPRSRVSPTEPSKLLLRGCLRAKVDPALPFAVFLTTYELAMADVEFLGRIRWRYAIIDEAQRIKNASSVLYKMLDERFLLPRRLLLTGTPVQNNLTELWALLHFCMPVVFADLEGFLEAFGPAAVASQKESAKVETAEKEDSRLGVLRRVIKVFMLRRTKAALLRTKALVLPPLTEVTIFTPLAPLQKHVYVSVLKKESPKLVGSNPGAMTSLQNIVIQLRKACSHPYLFDGVEPEPFQEGEHLVEASGKLKVLDSILRKLHGDGHRVLIFAQMTRTLDILQDYLEYRNYSYERLDGSVRAEERFVAVHSFSATHTNQGGFLSSSGRAFVFLLTTRAGGVGLNLVAADTVIFFEQDWNPQADRQALQRAHRMGQMSPVLAINLITPHTIEEVIMRRAKRKLELTYNVIGRDDADLESHGPAGASSIDLRSMIMFGLHTLHSVNDAEDVETLQTSELEELVTAALDLRGKADLDVPEAVKVGFVSTSSEASDAENFYKYEGQDFTKPADKAVLESWAADASTNVDTLPNSRSSLKRRASALVEDEVELEEARAEKRKKAEDRKRVKWNTLGYASLAVSDPGEDLYEDTSREVGADVHCVIGDCTQPSTTSANDACIILSVVDDSGTWGSAGMFNAVARLSPKVPEAYEAAHGAGDLHLGDFHLVPLSGDGASMGDGGDVSRYVGLAVIQTYDRRKKVPRSKISITALETCLRKLVFSATAWSASVHMPRVGARGDQGRNEWYSVERLLRKYATTYNVPFYVYYFRRNSA